MKRGRMRGYALLLVLLFMVLMLSLTSVAYREIAAMLRVESVRAASTKRDAGSMEALARALALLQTGTPPTNPYVTGLSLLSDTGTRSFTVTMTSAAVGLWTVHVAPTADGESFTPMPTTF